LLTAREINIAGVAMTLAKKIKPDRELRVGVWFVGKLVINFMVMSWKKQYGKFLAFGMVSAIVIGFLRRWINDSEFQEPEDL
jgi:hypothetical protein